VKSQTRLPGVTRQREFGAEHVSGAESLRDIHRTLETEAELSGGGEQDQRESDLRDDEAVPQTQS